MASQPSAKVAIHAFCNALQLLGLPSLAPESVRQAKFGSGDPEALWRVLHDYVVFNLAGPTSAPAISRFWVDLAKEQLEDTYGQLPDEGKDMVVQQLTLWGCPEALVRQLALPATPSTRHLLLALVWLAAKHDLFPMALRQLAVAPDMLLHLPPYPEDARCCMTTHQAYTTTASSASSHTSSVIHHITQLKQQAIDLATPPQRPAIRPGSGRLQPTLSKSDTAQQEQRQRDLFPNEDAVACLWQAVEAGSQCTIVMLGKMRAAMLSLQSHMDAITRLNYEVRSVQATAWPRAQPWSAFELRLLNQPALLRAHIQALSSATAALQQQAQLASGAHMFFKWASSVVAEEAAAVAQATGQRQPPQPIPQAQAPGAMRTLAALPKAGSPAAAVLLQRLQAQLSTTMQDTHPPTSALKPATAGVTAEHFRQLARSAVPVPTAADLATTSPADGHLVGHKQIITNPAQDAAWALPTDIQSVLSGSQAIKEEAEAKQQAWVHQQLLLRVGSACTPATAPPAAPLFGSAPGARGAPSGRPTDGPSHEANAASETSRLVDTTLSVARSLAQIRGTHRQLLLETADNLPEEFLVVGL